MDVRLCESNSTFNTRHQNNQCKLSKAKQLYEERLEQLDGFLLAVLLPLWQCVELSA
eukprot:m.351948 g.351948  ORF g.351948 m.351948 type:complete len:57 (-) comp16405_c0_seq1:3031-3201(-)